MKKILLALFVIGLLVYIALAFYKWNFNPGNWDEETRGSWGVIVGSISFLVLPIVLIDKK